MKYTVKVTQDHIDNGRICVADSCPVALAIKDKIGALGETINVGITRYYIRLEKIKYKTPCKVFNFISKFDRCKTVKPFSFVLNATKANEV